MGLGERLAASVLALGIVGSSCGIAPDTKINPTPKPRIEQPSQEALRITSQDFSKYFAECESKEQLFRLAQEQGKQFFPISLKNPGDIELKATTTQVGGKNFYAYEITAKNPVTILSPDDGYIGAINYNLRQKGAAIESRVKGPDQIEVAIIDFISANEEQTLLLEIGGDARVTFHKSSGSRVSRGEPIFSFNNSNSWIYKNYSVARDTFILIPYSVSYTSSGQGDLATANSKPIPDFFARTQDGKVLYCPPNK